MVKLWKYFKRSSCMSSCTTCCCAYGTLKDDEQSQVVKLPNGDSIVIQGYERNFVGSFLLVIVSLFTFFVGLIIASTRPGGLTPWFYRRSTLSRATKVKLPPQTMVTIQQDADDRRWFVWRHHRFTWSSQSAKFKRIRCVDEIGLRFSDIHGLGNGLDASNHQLRKDNYGRNTTDVVCPNLICLLLSALVKPFRLFHVAAITVWILQSYYVYAALIGLAALIEMISSILFQYQRRRRLYNMSLCSCEVTVLGPGHERRRIMSDDLVPGCVIELSSKGNLVMPCDAVLLSGSCLALEPTAVKSKHKYQLPKSRTEVYNPQKHRQHTLLRGSSIVLNSEKVVALVIRTGWSTESGAILAAKLDNAIRPSVFDHHCDRLFLCLGLTGLCAAVYSIYIRSFSLDIALLIPEGIHLITICLPPLFSPALFFTSLYSFIRLYQIGFRFHSFDELGTVLNHAGATDTACLLEDAIVQNADVKLVQISSTRYDEWLRDPQLTLSMTACINQHTSHDLSLFSNSAWQVIAQENNHRVQSIANEHEIYRITKIYADETNSSLPLILVRADPIESINANSWYFLRGSYSNVIEFAEEFPFDHKKDQLGLVAFAGRPLTESERSSVLDPDLNLLSRKFQLLGVASVEFQVSRETSDAVSELRSANIHTLLLSSRGTEEAVHLARNAGIILHKEPVARAEIASIESLHPPSLTVIDLPETDSIVNVVENDIHHHAHVVLTGNMLDALLQSFPEMVDQIIGRVTVFAEANPLQTNRFLERLHSLGRTILVCKNGEDSLNLSVPITCLTLTHYDELQVLHQDLCCDRSVSSIGELLGHSRASLVGCLGISKLMVCYAAIRLTSTLLLYHNPPPAIQTLYVDLALMMVPTFLFGCTHPRNQPLSNKMPARSIAHPKETLSVLAQLALLVGCQYLALVMAQHQPWFEITLPKVNLTAGPFISDEHYAVYSLSLFQYLSLFLIFFSGPPHLRRIWTNLGLVLYLLTLTIFSSVLVLEPPEQLKKFMGLKTPPVFDFRLALLSLAIIYVFTSVGVQYLLECCTVFTCKCRSSNQSSTDMGTPLDNVNVNILYRPSTLNSQQQPTANDLVQPTTLDLPIF